MPFEDHPLFTDPEETKTIWRYIDFTKFVSILDKNSIFFPSARELQKIDPWEGTYLKKVLAFNLKERFELEKSLNKNSCYAKLSNYEIAKEISQNSKLAYENQIDNNFISCWHFNSFESAAMWNLYLKSNEGICIQSDCDSFKKSFQDEDRKIYIGKVRYKDYANDVYYDDYPVNLFPGFNLFLPFIHKRKIYEHEREYRAIILNDDNKNLKNGIFIKVDLNTLIKKIILAPASPIWFRDLVRSVIKKYNYNFEICNSEVDDNPFDYDLSAFKFIIP